MWRGIRCKYGYEVDRFQKSFKIDFGFPCRSIDNANARYKASKLKFPSLKSSNRYPEN